MTIKFYPLNHSKHLKHVAIAAKLECIGIREHIQHNENDKRSNSKPV